MKKALSQLFLFTIILFFNLPAIANILVEYAGIVEQENNFELPELQVQSITNCDTSWFHQLLNGTDCLELVMFTDFQGDTIFRVGNRHNFSHNIGFEFYDCAGALLCEDDKFMIGNDYEDCGLSGFNNHSIIYDCSHECETFIGSSSYQNIING